MKKKVKQKNTIELIQLKTNSEAKAIQEKTNNITKQKEREAKLNCWNTIKTKSMSMKKKTIK